MRSDILLTTMILLLIMAGCGEGGKPAGDFFTVEVTQRYPKKELILQDFMEVEYIPLETTDDFIHQGNILAIGKKYIVVDYPNNGDIFIYDRTGKAIRKFNRKGQGGEEYLFVDKAVLDEDNEELFICENDLNKFLVYDLYGKFKRSFKIQEGVQFGAIRNFDEASLICSFSSLIEVSQIFNNQHVPSFFIISKQDGRIIKEIKIPYKQRISTMITVPVEGTNMVRAKGPGIHSNLIRYRDEWILAEPAADTLYRYLPDHRLIPFSARTPSIQSMEPTVFLFAGILSDRYFFMRTQTKEWERQVVPIMYDRQAKSLFTVSVSNADYSGEANSDLKIADMTHVNNVNDETVAFTKKLEAYQLVEAYEKGLLRGKLKEIAAKLDADSNPVIMIVKQIIKPATIQH